MGNISRVLLLLFCFVSFGFSNTYFVYGANAESQKSAYKTKRKNSLRGKNAKYKKAIEYETSENAKMHVEEIIRLYTEAAKNGHLKSALRLGHIYRDDILTGIIDPKSFHWFSKAAQQGSGEANYYLGLACYRGRGTEENHHKALEYLNLSASQGYVEAHLLIAQIYQSHNDIKYNPVIVEKHLRAAAETGHAGAARRFAFFLANVDKEKESVPWLRKCAASGDLSAKGLLAFYHSSGRGGFEKDMSKALKMYEELFEAGEIEYASRMSAIYWLGRDIPMDEDKSLFWAKKAAEAGYGPSQAGLAVYYERGIRGVDQDFEKAFYWYKKAVEYKHVQDRTKLSLAKMYEEGIGTEVNHKEAFKIYKEMSEKDFGKVSYPLGVKYYKGQGTEQNYLEAYRCFERHGGRLAKYYMGLMHFYGHEVKQDYSKAAKLFRDSLQILPDAKYHIGVLLLKGKGIKKDEEKGLLFLAYAAKEKHAGAYYALGRINLSKGNNIKAYMFFAMADRLGSRKAKKQVRDMQNKKLIQIKNKSKFSKKLEKRVARYIDGILAKDRFGRELYDIYE